MDIIDLSDFRNRKMSRNGYATSGAYKSKLYILVGIPCAGKSTYAGNFLKDHDVKIVSTDEIRKELTGTYKYSSNENYYIFKTAKQRIRENLASGLDVIFDATNIYRESREDFIDIAKDTNSLVIAVVFKTSLELCLERNSKRPSERRVPKNVIEDMFFGQVNPVKDEGFNEIIVLKS